MQTQERGLTSPCLSVLVCENETRDSAHLAGFCEDEVSYQMRNACNSAQQALAAPRKEQGCDSEDLGGEKEAGRLDGF